MGFDRRNCTNVPNSAATDAGVAGTGVLLSFIITAGISLLLSLIIVLHESRRKNEARISRKLLLSFSDQQIITGIGIQSVALSKMQYMVPYHFFMVWMLSILSTATHISTLLALVNDFKRDWVLRWLRQFLMFVNLVLSIVSGVFVLLSTTKDLKDTLPIACVWEVPYPKFQPRNAAISIAGTMAVMAGNCIFFVLAVWYLHSRGQRWLRFVQIAGLLVLIAIGAGAAIRVLLISQAFGNPPSDLKFKDQAEKDWSFGQLLPLLLLLLPVVSALEITRGEMRVPAPMVDGHMPLDHESKPASRIRESWQRNPFFSTGRSRFSN
ncbi:hypothetical protein M501DRAFT_848474 [Patellaria atrata CBS 101060]|uniref:Uncharacterized protein n=1 Tax=Patellaria atrata CBS 101060 TaxID=1346257 RepID=A0A9P4SAH9_9PEZI|nr:hypothetical protein M501DRAFT_848474 [Patellaria atrata CBS 101060]